MPSSRRPALNGYRTAASACSADAAVRVVRPPAGYNLTFPPRRKEPPREEDQGEEPRRRDGRRRDDPHHLAEDPREADPAVPRHRPQVLRPRHRAPRRDRRQDHVRLGRGHQAVRRGGEVRHHHPRRGPGQGVRPQADVPVAQRHHPQHPQRHHLPRADRLHERAAPRRRTGTSRSSSPATGSATSTAPRTSSSPAPAR